MSSDAFDPRITEQRNPRTVGIDLASPLEIVDLIGAEDGTVPAIVGSQRERIAEVISAAEATFRNGGRLIYVGAGTSGRLGVVDASECPPTFGTHPDMVQAIIAGGPAAMTVPQEGAEDRPEGGADAIDERSVGPKDLVIGIAASGTTPFVRGALQRAKVLGARTAIVACSPPPAETLAAADHAILPITGPEAVTGSTRMKAGTATKLVLNMITTGAMIRLGKTFGNLMVDLMATNAKLKDRSERIIAEVCGVTRVEARRLLGESGGRVKTAIVMYKLSLSRAEAEQALEEAGGVIRRVVHEPPPPISVAPRSSPPKAAPEPATPERSAPAGDGTRGAAEPVIVGLMSGTSLDGISAAVVRFRRDAGSSALDPVLLAATGRSYTPAERQRLLRALEGATPADYCRLNFDLGEWLADAAVQALADAGVRRDEVSAVATHGQTVWHEPGHSTWQFGEAAVIAERLGVPVVSDFRVRDMAAGGQGAPLVPIADALLFAARDTWRALQNIGGIGNVSVVPPRGDLAGVRAFDTGPGVAVIDGVVRALVPGATFDAGGEMALRGRAVSAVVDHMLADAYFASPPPKSTGRELFSSAYVERFIAAVRAARPAAGVEDVVATAVSLTARSIADSYRRFLPDPITEVLLSGGGAKNPALFAAVASALAPLTVRRFDDVFFDGEAKEAVAFALLGYLHLFATPGNVPRATGARGPRVLGKLTPP